jgi:hypothetical protein
MNPHVAAELMALASRWHERARNFMAEAERPRRPFDIVRLTALASTLDFCARELTAFVERSGESD